MTDPQHLAVGETVESSSPKVTLGPQKAVIAAVVGGISAGAAALLQALTDGSIYIGEFYVILGAVLAGAGLTGGTTFAKSTTVTAN